MMKRLSLLFVALTVLLSGLTFAAAEEEPLKITYFKPATGSEKWMTSLTTYDDVAAIQYVQQLFNVDFEMIESGELELIIASGDYPDVVFVDWRNYNVDELIEDGFIAELMPEMLEKYAPNYWKVITETPNLAEQLQNNGRYYCLAGLKIDPGLRAGGPILRKDWLDKLNLDVPVTIDDWYNVLCAFRDGDPNGNGIADEIPLMLENSTDLEGIRAWTAPFGTIQGFCMKDGKVTYGPIEPEFKDYLTTMQQWYAEGLLEPDFASQDRTAFSAKVTTDIAGAWIGRVNGTLGNYLTARDADGTTFDLVGTAWPQCEDGHSYNIRSNMLTMFEGCGIAITTANKNMEKTLEVFDYFYGEEGHMLANFGIEGISYTMEDGVPVYTDLIANNPDGLSVDNALAAYAISMGSEAIVQDIRYFTMGMTYAQQSQAVEAWGTSETTLLVPPISLTGEESTRLDRIMGDIDILVSEWATKTIMGLISLDEYETYVSQIKKMNIEEAIAIENAAYDRSCSK